MIGKVVFHYKILEKLGEGGMGIVYKADDLKLTRTVALKFLPHGVDAHETERARFLQEARAAATLNHPNICTIHDIQEFDGQRFIVMEYVEGKTLREIVPVKKIQDAIMYATQIAEALQEAHTHGIVHRDIKADNILVNSKNQVKVMDFGLAKLKGSVKLTKTSSTTGTLAYMAPEQIQGEEADARSDIFSFGIVLYEMLTGHLPFRGEHEAAMVYSIVNEEPEPLQHYVPDAPSELLHILDRAMEKDREDRYQSVHEMLIDLRRLRKETGRVLRRPVPEGVPLSKGEGESATAASATDSSMPGRISRKRVILASFGVLFVALSVILYFLLFQGSRETAQPTRTQLTFSGDVTLAEISPDGKSFAFVNADHRLLVQDISGGEPLEVFKARRIDAVRWAPNGTELAVNARIDTSWATFIVPRFGGTYRRFGRIGHWISWSPDGTCVAGTLSRSGRVFFLEPSSGKDSVWIPLKDASYWTRFIDWSPAGDFIAVLSVDSLEKCHRILTTSRDGSRQSTVVQDSAFLWNPRWSPRGDGIYYRWRGDILKIDVDPATGEAKGAPRRIQAGQQIRGFSLSHDNRMLVGTWGFGTSNLWWTKYDLLRSGRVAQERQITEGTGELRDAKISPEGKRIAFVKSGQRGFDLYVASVDGGDTHQLTFGDVVDGELAWSPDGKQIAYVSFRGEISKLCFVSAEGGSPRIMEKAEVSPDAGISWAPGPCVLYQRPGDRNFHILDPSTGKERPLLRNDSLGLIFGPQYSPDGGKIAAFWSRRGANGIYILSPDDTTQQHLIEIVAGPLRWSADSKTVFVRDGHDTRTILAVSLATGKAEKLLTLRNKNATALDLDPTANTVLWRLDDYHSDAWLIKNFDPELE